MKRVTREELKSEYSDIDNLLTRFCDEYPEYDKYRMIQEILQGETVMWGDKEAFVIGKPKEYHNKEFFWLDSACGRIVDRLDTVMDVIESDVKAWGYESIEFGGRLGWEKPFKDLGYEKTTIVMKKEI